MAVPTELSRPTFFLL